ncbi:hypothetical protein [Methylobacterium aquaticum]|uniref:hypothetical protein n=1 Tax=Methylobacterium aquaticum TaxID=270351 RepID=UPI0011AE807E|nr:hypothetical protein [Methylobacterium aquaticum]
MASKMFKDGIRRDLENEVRRRWPERAGELREQLRQQQVAPKVIADNIRATGGTPISFYKVLADLIDCGFIPVDAHPERANLGEPEVS